MPLRGGGGELGEGLEWGVYQTEMKHPCCLSAVSYAGLRHDALTFEYIVTDFEECCDSELYRILNSN